MSNKIKYITGDLFSNTESCLLHACNCKKVWGSGVAVLFRMKFPKAYEEYKKFAAKTGDVIFITADTQPVICLFTSYGYGREVDGQEYVLRATKKALDKLGEHCKDFHQLSIASPKINAGLFRVPWEKTEALIEDFLEKNPHITWSVYCL